MTLGCADSYQAVIHYTGGELVYHVPQMGSATQITWSRVLDATGEAVLTIAKEEAGKDCCSRLGSVLPWCHELSIYRDDQLVWQGPIVRYEESRTTVTITAEDVTAWLAKLENYHTLSYEELDATAIAEDVIRWNLAESALSMPPDYPSLLDYMVREPVDARPVYRPGLYIAPVLDIVNELAAYGFQWTTVGRSLYLRAALDETSTPQTRLTGADFIGELSVVRDGAAAATNAFATNQQQDPNTGRWSGSAYVASLPSSTIVCGRLDTLVQITDQEATTGSLRAAARAALGGRWPPPLVLEVPDGSQLSPNAPISIEQLVCGERIDVQLDDYCRPVSAGFRLAEVAGSWYGGQEAIQISLAPLSGASSDL